MFSTPRLVDVSRQDCIATAFLDVAFAGPRHHLISVLWWPGLAVLIGMVTSSVTLGAALLVLGALVNLLWRTDGPPFFLFCLGFQWCFIVAGILYGLLFGVALHAAPGNMDRATMLSLLGLLAIAVGITTAQLLAAKHLQHSLVPSGASYNVERLFVSVLGLFWVNWFITLSPLVMSWTGAQIVLFALYFRYVLLAVLFLETFRQRHGYGYSIAALLFVVVPELASMMSAFKGVLFIFVLALLAGWQRRPQSSIAHGKNRRIAILVVGIGCALLFSGMVWEGVIKPTWRPAVMGGIVSGTPMERVSAFRAMARESSRQFSVSHSLGALTRRMSSATYFFSLTLERVPAVLPYERGAMTGRALRHLMKPRILFPDKPNLGSDSWLVRRYAGVYVAGAESGTSVGLGYMAQFYIDFGPVVMFVALFAMGIYIGSGFALLKHVAPSRQFYFGAAIVVAVRQLMTYEGELAKTVGGITMNIAVFAAVFLVAGSTLHRFFVFRRRVRGAHSSLQPAARLAARHQGEW